MSEEQRSQLITYFLSCFIITCLISGAFDFTGFQAFTIAWCIGSITSPSLINIDILKRIESNLSKDHQYNKKEF